MPAPIVHNLMQADPSVTPSATAILYGSLLLIFATAIVTTVLTKWSRDKCLKFFHHYHVTLERLRGQTTWGKLRVFSSGIEIVYDHPYVDALGRKKTSYLIYQQELDQQVLVLLRYQEEMSAESRKQRRAQVHRTFNPGPLRRLWRGVRNFVNTLRDAFNNAIGAVVGQYQRMNPASAAFTAQSGSVTAMGQTLLSKFANSYEPLLEQYIGQPVILDVADPINPNHGTVQYAGYLADYTQNYVAIFNVEHDAEPEAMIELPDAEGGEPLPPLPPPPPAGATPIAMPLPMSVQEGFAIHLDGKRVKLRNTRYDPIVVRRLERPGFEAIEFGTVIPSNATFDLPARDARGAKLFVQAITRVDVVASRKFATIRHAGVLLERRGLVDELALDRLPMVPKFLSRDGKAHKPGATPTADELSQSIE